MNSIKGPARRTFLVPFTMFRAVAFHPGEAERTSYRVEGNGVRVCVWPTRQAMLKAVEMQPQHVKGATQWKPFEVEQKVPKT
jgi:hypothetical protein